MDKDLLFIYSKVVNLSTYSLNSLTPFGLKSLSYNSKAYLLLFTFLITMPSGITSMFDTSTPAKQVNSSVLSKFSLQVSSPYKPS